MPRVSASTSGGSPGGLPPDHCWPDGRSTKRRLHAISRWLLSAGTLTLLASAATAATLVVGPPGTGPTFAQVLREARDGDTIAVLPGEYRGDVAAILQRRLTIRGIGARPVFAAAGQHAEGKAIRVVRDGDIHIENIEFRGARVPARNGAGIRFERGRLHLLRCAFIDNENGVLTGNHGNAETDIEDSEFAQTPPQRDSLPHLLYIGSIARASVTGSRFHQGFEGHLIKSRAAQTRIAYNLIVDGAGGRTSYEVELPNGGLATLIGNVIGQSATTENPTLVSYGAEGDPWPRSALVMAHNTLLSDRVGSDPLLRVWSERLPPATPVLAVNNLLLGAGLLAPGAAGRFEGNRMAAQSMLFDPGGLAFGLPADSPLRGTGVDPRDIGGHDLAPRAELKLPIGTQPLASLERWSPGAFQR